MEKVRARTHEVIADILLSHPEEDSSEDEKPFVDFVRRIVHSNMISSRFITKAEEATRDTMICEDVVARISKEVFRSDRMMKPIGVFVRYRVFHHVHVKVAEERLLNSRRPLTVQEEESVSILHGDGGRIHSTHCERPRCEKKDETDSAVDSSDDEMLRNRIVRETKKDKNGNHADDWTDDELFASDQSESEIDSRIKVIRPVAHCSRMLRITVITAGQ